MELVRARNDDVDVLADLWYSLASEMVEYSELNELTADVRERAWDGVTGWIQRDDTTVFLIKIDSTTIGYVLLEEGERPSREHSEYTKIVDLFVEADYRNQGHGSEVIDLLKERAREGNSDYLEVSCEWNNVDARRFYEDTGFTEKRVTFVRELDS
jgi:GNAT superfamily N-acetyltransferase